MSKEEKPLFDLEQKLRRALQYRRGSASEFAGETARKTTGEGSLVWQRISLKFKEEGIGRTEWHKHLSGMRG